MCRCVHVDQGGSAAARFAKCRPRGRVTDRFTNSVARSDALVRGFAASRGRGGDAQSGPCRSHRAVEHPFAAKKDRAVA